MDKMMDIIRKSITTWLEATRENFERDGECLPLTLMLVRRMPDGSEVPDGQLAPAYIPMLEFMKGELAKEVGAAIIKKTAASLRAVLVMFVTESWVVDYQGERTSAEYKELIEAANRGELHSHPKRKEAVSVMVEAIHGVQETYRGYIVREPGQPPRLEPWKLMPGATMGAVNAGRFSGFLPPDATA